MEIDELKNIWKESKTNNIKSSGDEYESMISKLRKAERKVLVRYSIMTFFMAFAFYMLGGKVLSYKKYDDLTYAGFYLLFAAMLSVGIMVWSTVIILKKNNITNPGLDFLKQVKNKFNRRKLIRKIVIPIYLAAITVGVSLIYLEVFSLYSITARIIIHIAVVVFILVISYIASKREKMRDEKIYKPIEEQIDGLIKEYNEQQ